MSRSRYKSSQTYTFHLPSVENNATTPWRLTIKEIAQATPHLRRQFEVVFTNFHQARSTLFEAHTRKLKDQYGSEIDFVAICNNANTIHSTRSEEAFSIALDENIFNTLQRALIDDFNLTKENKTKAALKKVSGWFKSVSKTLTKKPSISTEEHDAHENLDLDSDYDSDNDESLIYSSKRITTSLERARQREEIEIATATALSIETAELDVVKQLSVIDYNQQMLQPDEKGIIRIQVQPKREPAPTNDYKHSTSVGPIPPFKRTL